MPASSLSPFVRRARRIVLCGAPLLSLSFVLTRAMAQGPTAAKVGPVFINGMAQVVPAFQGSSAWIRQELWVQTNFDSDHDGKPDRVHVDVTRPGQTETEGLKVPIVYGSSPYY